MDNLIPAPVRTEDGGPHAFLPDRSTTLTAHPGTESAERWLRTTLGGALGLPLAPGTRVDGAGNTVELRIDACLEPEGYRLSVAPGAGVRITGGSAAGVFWGRRPSVSSWAPKRSAAHPSAPVHPGEFRPWRSRTGPAFPGAA